jgi:hypothetical protein
LLGIVINDNDFVRHLRALACERAHAPHLEPIAR